MKKLAVHLHIYYKEQVDEICRYLKNLADVNFDLFVSLVEKDEKLEAAVKKVVPQANFFVVENRGYDIGPFIEFLHKINFDDYEYILKLHTKGKKSKNYTWLNGRRMDNALWGKVLWDSMLGEKSRLKDNLHIMDVDKTITMAGSEYCITDNRNDYGKLLPKINEALTKIGKEPVDSLSFVAGSMFLARAECLVPLLKYGIGDFSATDGDVKEGTLAHVIERVFGVLGEDIAPIGHGSYWFDFFREACKRFWYQNKVTQGGKRIIKICKVPVYVRQLKNYKN